jgi:hypothetical protein
MDVEPLGVYGFAGGPGGETQVGLRVISLAKEALGKARSEVTDGRTVRRNRALGIGLAAVIAASTVSWAAASRIRSPAEVAARTAPPVASPITVAVEKKVLTSDVVVRGTVRYGAPQGVILPMSAAKKAPGLVTTSPVKGQELKEGQVALTTSGTARLSGHRAGRPGRRRAPARRGPGAAGHQPRQA